MSNGQEYRFKIDVFTPETLPMARLAEYLADLATMLGEEASVHLVRLEGGSTEVVHLIEATAVPKVRERVNAIRRGDGPSDAMKAYQQTNRRLKDDNCIGVLTENGTAEIIRFPGREMEVAESYGPFNQDGALDGKIIMVGGKADPVPVHVQQGEVIYNCYASRSLASELGRYLFESELRVKGNGRWTREPDGAWTLNRFTIKDYEVLKDEPLSAVIAELREIPGSGWNKVADPWEEIMNLRQHGGGAN